MLLSLASTCWSQTFLLPAVTRPLAETFDPPGHVYDDIGLTPELLYERMSSAMQTAARF
jgi:hypothetical protein